MAILYAAIMLTAMSLRGQTLILSPNNDPTAAKTGVGIYLTVLNESETATNWAFPSVLEARVYRPGATTGIDSNFSIVKKSEAAPLAPGSFARAAYQATFPPGLTGQVVVVFSSLGGQKLALDRQPPAGDPSAPPTLSKEPRKTSLSERLIRSIPARPSGEQFEPVAFFKEHIFPYEPLYFLAGTESPNAKFQISFRYQLLNNEGSLATNAPLLKGFNVAYTQISLWDWNKASAPFFDSSYKPEFLYRYEGLLGKRKEDWFHLDLQTGVQHESNGKDGDNSRSLNIAYFRPTITVDITHQAQFTLIPRAWLYVGDTSDNPDIARYRGYADLRAMLTIRGLQISALGRLGDRGDRGSMQFDVTYPLMNLWNNFSVYLHAQYFDGYGESLLEYNKHSTSVRLGFSLYR